MEALKGGAFSYERGTPVGGMMDGAAWHALAGNRPTECCRANVAPIRQSRRDSGLDVQVKDVKSIQVVPSAPGSGLHTVHCGGTSLIRNHHLLGPLPRALW